MGDKRMTEEEYFRKTYPDSCYGDRPLSPYWDFFQDGVEFSERQSEKKIEKLKRKLEQTEKDLADYQFNYSSIKELKKENAELKRNKKTVVHLAECLEEKQKEQLEQAKKIIKGLLSCCRNYPQENAEKMEQAEQFLQEIKENE